MSFCPSTSLLKLYFAILSIPPDPSVYRNAAKVDDALPLTLSPFMLLSVDYRGDVVVTNGINDFIKALKEALCKGD